MVVANLVSKDPAEVIKGKLVSGNEYWLVETEAFTDANGVQYGIAAPVKLTWDATGNGHASVRMVNKKTNVTIKKTDSAGNWVGGATLVLSNVSGDATFQPKTYKTEDFAALKQIVESGTLKVGATYRLTETVVPTNYINPNPNYKDFTVPNDGVIEVEFVNSKIDEKEIEVKKNWTVDGSLHTNAATTVTIDLFRKLATETGYPGTALMTQTLTYPNTTVKFSGLQVMDANQTLYQYKVVETAPDGWTLTYDVDETFQLDGELPKPEITNTATVVTIRKTGKGGDNAALLAGAKLAIYESSATAPTKADFANATPVWTGVSAETELKIVGLLNPAKTYWLVETEAPDGYVCNDTPVKIDWTGTSIGNAGINNDQTKLTVEKLGKDGDLTKRLGGAGLTIYLYDPTSTTDVPTKASFAGKTPVWADTSSDTAALEVVGVLSTAHTYWLVETSAPNGYVLSDAVVRIDMTTGTASVSMQNTRTSVIIRKTAGGNGLAGATLKVYETLPTRWRNPLRIPTRRLPPRTATSR